MESVQGMIETIFRFPPNKPPYLGVVFGGEGGKLYNASWVENHSNEDWEIKAELQTQTFKITLYCTKLSLKYTYSTPMINQQELARFIEETQKVEYFNFGHVDKHKGVYTPIRTVHFKPWVLKCCNFEFRWEY